MKIQFVKSSILIAFIALIATPSVLKAQGGIKAGLNASTLSFDKMNEKRERFGYHVSVFTNVNLVDGFMSLQPEVGFSTQGTAFKSSNERQRLNMNYVNLHVPLSFKLSNVDLQVGPYVGYLASKPNYEINDVTILTDAFKKVDVGLSGGLNYNFDKYFVGLRYSQGLMDVTKDNSRALLGSAKNAVGQVSFGYRF